MLLPAYIVFEGCIASGKTTLASELSKHMNVKSIIENVHGHPFIKDFYQDQDAYAFETELIFPVMHYHQLSKAAKEGIFKQNVVSDFFMEKDLIFPLVTLKKKQDVEIFTTLWSSLRKRVRTPDLVVFLDAPTDFLLNRVRQRGRDYEKSITFEYLDEVNRAYKSFMKNGYDKSEIVTLDATKLAKSPSHAVSEVRGMLENKFDI